MTEGKINILILDAYHAAGIYNPRAWEKKDQFLRMKPKSSFDPCVLFKQPPCWGQSGVGRG